MTKMRLNFFGAAILSAALLLSGCGGEDMAALYDNSEKIAAETNSFNLSGIRQVALNEHYSANIGKMEGMDTVWIYNAEEDERVDFTYLLKVYSGKLKLVLISPEGEVSTIVECEEEMEEAVSTGFNVSAGKNRIKIVAGKETEFDVDLSATAGKFLKMGF